MLNTSIPSSPPAASLAAAAASRLGGHGSGVADGSHNKTIANMAFADQSPM